MGSMCDMADINRFCRSEEGKMLLDEIKNLLLDRKIVDVKFEKQISNIEVNITLDNEHTVTVLMPFLDVYSIRENYSEIINREYLKDYPERDLKKLQ